MKAAAVAVLVACVLTVATSTASAAPTSQIQQAQAYIRAHGGDANRVEANVFLVQLGISVLTKSATQANANKLALTAQSAHDNLNNIRSNFAESDSGAFGNAELSVFAGANDLKNAMGALVAWCGNPNAATLAHFSSQYQTGRAEWNSGVKAIWRMAHKSKPPTI